MQIRRLFEKINVENCLIKRAVDKLIFFTLKSQNDKLPQVFAGEQLLEKKILFLKKKYQKNL